MTDFKVTDEAVETACSALASALEFEDKWPEDYTEEQRVTVRTGVLSCIEAALPVMFERVGKVCMNGSRYGHGLFADIEVQYDEPQSPAPNIGSDLYIIKEPK